jgi:tetratricopeptide (TPR) repeat protein
MKRFFYVSVKVCVVLMPMVNGLAGEEFELPRLAAKVRPAVVLVLVNDSLGKTIATGSGFFVSSDGKVVTNHHVIEKAASVEIKGENGAIYEVEGLLVDEPDADIAVLKATAKNVPFLEVVSSQQMQIGEHIAVVGSPMGLEGTLSEGIISAKRKVRKDGGDWLQITAAISPGSSGSPVLNGAGQVVGIATMLLRESQSLNFAVPSEQIQHALSGSSKNEITRPFTNSPGEMDSDPDVKSLLAMLRSGDSAGAIKLARQITLHHATNPAAYFLLGEALLVMDFKDEALEAFEHSLTLDPNFVGSLLRSAKLLAVAGKREMALKRATRALSIDPELADAWFTYGRLLRSSLTSAEYRQANQMRAKAIDAFERTIAVEAKSKQTELTRGAWLNLAEIYGEQGDACSTPTSSNFNAAVPYYRQAIQAQKHAIASAGYNETTIDMGLGKTGTLSSHLTASILWNQLFLFYYKALVREETQSEEKSLREDALRQLKTLEQHDAKLAEELRAGLPDKTAEERFRRIRRHIEEQNRLGELQGDEKSD